MSDHPTVEYREIKGFPGYRVGNDGSVWTCRPRNGIGGLKSQWKPLSLKPSSRGVPRITLRPAHVSRAVHRLILEAFVGPRPKGMQACHFPDRDKTNNRLSNLRWDTAKANCNDAAIHGTACKGEKHGRAILTAKDVIKIRESRGRITGKALAEKYGVSQSLISAIRTGKVWRNV